MKRKYIILFFILFVLQLTGFHLVCRFLFPFKEQLQLFQFTAQYAVETLKQAGGLALYISEFLTQFYVILWIGPLITAAL